MEKTKDLSSNVSLKITVKGKCGSESVVFIIFFNTQNGVFYMAHKCTTRLLR